MHDVVLAAFWRATSFLGIQFIVSNCRTTPAAIQAERDGFIDPKHSALYAIRYARERFDDIAHRIDGIVWEAEPGTHKISFISAQVEQILGFCPKQCCAEGFWDAHVHPDDVARVIQLRAAAIDPSVNYAIEFRMMSRDGHVVWLQDNFRLVVTAATTLLRGILTDISQRKLAEEALQFSDMLFQYCTDSVTITDGALRIQRINAAFSAITGYQADEVRGQTPRILRSGVQDQGFYQVMWKAIEQHGHWRGELWNRRKSGELYIQQLSVVRICNDSGEVTNYLGVARDVTQSKAIEEQMEQFAHVDALTGLPNRPRLTTHLHSAISGAQAAHRRFAVLSVDIDRLAYMRVGRDSCKIPQKLM